MGETRNKPITKKQIDDYEVIIVNPEAIPIVGRNVARLLARLYMEGKIKLPEKEKEAV